jgi:hypothetical protein
MGDDLPNTYPGHSSPPSQYVHTKPYVAIFASIEMQTMVIILGSHGFSFRRPRKTPKGRFQTSEN